MAEVLNLPPSGHMTIEQALDVAKRDFGNLENVIVLGMDHAGEVYTLSSHMQKERAVWILEKAKLGVLGLDL